MTNATLRERFGAADRNAAGVSCTLSEAVDAGTIAIEDPDAGRRSRTYVPFRAVPDAGEAQRIV